MPRVTCVQGGWVYGTQVAFPMDPRCYADRPDVMVPCNQLFCAACQVPVKHMDGVQNGARWSKTSLATLYDSTDPDLWLEEVELVPAYRLYYCQCHWYATPGGTPVGNLDTKDIDDWACHGHPSGADGA